MRHLCLLLVLVNYLLGYWLLSCWLWSPLTLAAAETAPMIVSTSESLSTASTAPSANDIAAEKVSQFIQAYLQVLQLLEMREGALQAAETQLEAQQLEQEIESEAQKLIEKAGLTRQEYLQLLSLANIDPEFGERLAIQLQEAD